MDFRGLVCKRVWKITFFRFRETSAVLSLIELSPVTRRKTRQPFITVTEKIIGFNNGLKKKLSNT